MKPGDIYRSVRRQLMEDFVQPAVGLGESALTVGSSLAAMPFAGWKGIHEGIRYGSVDKAADAMNEFMEQHTWQPRTDQGQQQLTTIGDAAAVPFESLARSPGVGDAWDWTVENSPVTAAAIMTGLEVADPTKGVGRTASRVRRATAAIPEPKIMPQIEVDGRMQYGSFVEPVHVDDLINMQGNRLGKTDLEELKAQIQADGGLKEPVIIQVGQNDRSAIVGEGNHRVQAAKELGYEYIPARVIVQRETHAPQKHLWADLIPEKGVYFKSDAKPSEVFRNVRVAQAKTATPRKHAAKRAAGQGMELPPRHDYPPVPEPEHKVDPKSGKEYLGKGTSEETTDFLKRRRIAQKDIDAGNYEPYFNPHERYDATGYDPAADTTQYARPKKEATVQKWREQVQTDDARQRLQAAFDAGVQSGGHDRWYQVGQLQKAFIDELGPEEGAKRFDEFFAQAMAATTGGADPTSNLMMAHFGNYRRAQGLQADVPAYEMPVPIGGRYASGNMAMYERALGADGTGLDPSGHPKRHNFAANFRGDRNLVTVDEQMTGLITPELKAPPNNSYFAYEELIRETAEKNGVDPREFQEVAWGGKKWTDTGGKYQGKAMIEHVNEAIERTSRLTGMTPDEVVKGMIHGNRMLGNARTDLLTLLGGGAAAAAVGANLLDTEEKRK